VCRPTYRNLDYPLDGIRIFLHRYGLDPALGISNAECRINTLSTNEGLCSVDEEAECFWIVEES
jgi:hypothetical protein